MKCRVVDTAEIGITEVRLSQVADGVFILTIPTDEKWPEFSEYSGIREDGTPYVGYYILKPNFRGWASHSRVEFTPDSEPDRILINGWIGQVCTRYGLTAVWVSMEAVESAVNSGAATLFARDASSASAVPPPVPDTPGTFAPPPG